MYKKEQAITEYFRSITEKETDYPARVCICKVFLSLYNLKKYNIVKIGLLFVTEKTWC